MTKPELKRCHELIREFATFALECWDLIPDHEPDIRSPEVIALLGSNVGVLAADLGSCDKCGKFAPLKQGSNKEWLRAGAPKTFNVCYWGCEMEES